MARSRLDIMLDILGVALNDATKTKIAFAVNLKIDTVERYLDLLTDEGLILMTAQTSTYRTTEKGKDLLKKASEIALQ
ncbi:MAG: winged helix-turn-helix domain-containing protein [Halobacteriota archaeon]|nr:winged helix-turn-helix domain-containing protein [Halobacteriota archaeon]